MTRRKKIKPKKGTKWVRVDHKTLIEVDIDKPEEEAIKEFLEKTGRSRPTYLYRGKRKNGS